MPQRAIPHQPIKRNAPLLLPPTTLHPTLIPSQFRAVWEQLLKDVDELKKSRVATVAPRGASGNEAPPSTIDDGTGGEGTKTPAPEAPAAASGSKNYLLLPDISFNAQAKGHYSSDKRDEDRRRGSLAEAEIAVQGDVYPGVRAEAFIVAEPGENNPFQVEQGFIDFLGIRKNLNIRVGRDFTPFGRTGRQHTHSWLYTRQLIPIHNIVASEELGGDGVSFSYVLPTRGKLRDLTLWNRSGEKVLTGEVRLPDHPQGDTPYLDSLVRAPRNAIEIVHAQFLQERAQLRHIQSAKIQAKCLIP